MADPRVQNGTTSVAEILNLTVPPAVAEASMPAIGAASGAENGRPRRRRWPGHVPGELGIWLFILAEMFWFALFFGMFMRARSSHVSQYELGRRSLLLGIGTLNTLFLLTASLLVVGGVVALRAGVPERARRLFAVAMLCGLGFVIDKAIEWTSLLSAGHTPGSNTYYMYFFTFTGIHLMHLLVGMVALVFMWRKAGQQTLTASEISHVEVAASYWHLVDVLWLVLFALLYLVR
jgi:nitric oxide reductase NorE protein